MSVPFAVFASGSGTNMQALLDHEREGAEYRIEVLVTDRPCAAEERARARGRAVYRVDFGSAADGDADDCAGRLLGILGDHDIAGVLLAGFLRLVPAEVCAAYRDRILNIHPALLPSFGGRGMYGHHVHEAVLRSGAARSGATVHFADERYDEGRILAQWPVPVRPGDTPDTLAARVLRVEHALYPAAADALARAVRDGWPERGPEPHVTRRRALVSVSDKTGVAEFGMELARRGWEVLSTGGTARTLREAGVPVTEVAVVTGHPEMMDGRVKTLHPAIHAGLLARRDRPGDLGQLARQGYGPIDLVAVNLYPFRETVADPDVTRDRAMEQVDIGGPTLIRAAAKNHRDVWVVVDPADYAAVLDALAGEGEGEGGRSGEREREPGSAPALRRTLAANVFREMASYDRAVADYLEHADSAAAPPAAADPEPAHPAATDPAAAPPAATDPAAAPPRITLHLTRRSVPRYGENPGQSAGFYAPEGTREGVAGLEQLHGKELSYNNILDLDGALISLAPFAFSPDPAVCIVKHTTPCGLALRPTLAAAFERARATDPVSAFGSVVAVNRPVDAETATRIAGMFVECVVAPDFAPDALAVLTAKRNIRLLRFEGDAEPHPAEPVRDAAWTTLNRSVRAAARFLARAAGHAGEPHPSAPPGDPPIDPHATDPHASPSLRSVYGGVLLQSLPDPPFHGAPAPDWRVVTARAPTDAELADLSFAWAAVAGVKSNAILLAAGLATIGIGAGQTSRVDSSRLAVRKARDHGFAAELDGCVLASDAFFPFRDGVDAAAEAGARAIIQPGGSIRDDEVVAAADEHGIAMVFTGRRLFRH